MSLGSAFRIARSPVEPSVLQLSSTASNEEEDGEGQVVEHRTDWSTSKSGIRTISVRRLLAANGGR